MLTVQTQAGPSASLRVDRQVVPLPFMLAGQCETGLLLADGSLKPIYVNDAARSILCYPNELRAAANPMPVQERIRSILPEEHFTARLLPVSFLSGRRLYICRSFLIESHDTGTPPATVVVVLERTSRSRSCTQPASRADGN